MVDHSDRHIAGEILTSQGVHLVHATHEMYLVAHKQRGGLTNKEYQFLMARHDAILQEQRKLHKLVERLRRHGNTST